MTFKLTKQDKLELREWLDNSLNYNPTIELVISSDKTEARLIFYQFNETDTKVLTEPLYFLNKIVN